MGIWLLVVTLAFGDSGGIKEQYPGTQQIQSAEATPDRSAKPSASKIPASEPTGRDDGRTGFWVIGMVVNLTVLTAFILWATKEWRRRRR